MWRGAMFPVPVKSEDVHEGMDIVGRIMVAAG